MSLLCGCSDSGYYKKSGRWHYDGKVNVVPLADPATFRMMSDGYTPRDKAHIFYETHIVPIRDPASYELLEHAFTKDRISAYYRSNEIVGSDASSFLVLDAHYAKDKAVIYYVDGFHIGGFVKNIRPDAFRTLGEGYAKTESQIIYQGNRLADADVISFAVDDRLDPNFDAHDKNGRFRDGKRVKPNE